MTFYAFLRFLVEKVTKNSYFIYLKQWVVCFSGATTYHRQNTKLMLDNDFTQHINSQGYYVWPWRQDIFQWSQSLLTPARQAMATPEHQHWWHHQNTWFVGVNALPNNPHGQVAKGKAMMSWLQGLLETYCLHAPLNLDKGQISTCHMGYPQQDQDEPNQNYYFRKHFYAAHMDGLIPEGKQRRRYLKEYHSFILGVPLTEHDAQAAPLMVWPNSHQRLQTWLLNEFANIPVAQ